MNNQNSNQNNDSTTNHQLGMIALAGIAALIWKNETTIRIWFYQNVLFLTAGGIALIALLGFYLWSRFKKKEAEYFERRRNLRQVETTTRNINYYKRKED